MSGEVIRLDGGPASSRNKLAWSGRVLPSPIGEVFGLHVAPSRRPCDDASLVRRARSSLLT
jgi:hypothetical protein